MNSERISSRTGRPVNTKITGRPPASIIGNRYGKLVVVSEMDKSCFCKCDCGNGVYLKRKNIVKGHIGSCGCMKGNPTHHKTKTRLYTIWGRMKARCADKSYPQFYLYGGRGITVCEEWANDFMAFFNWAMGNGYSNELSIDRINNDKGYSPDNCWWATNIQQANNKRNNHLLEVNGDIKTIAQWAREIGANVKTVSTWVCRKGDEYAINRIKSAVTHELKGEKQ